MMDASTSSGKKEEVNQLVVEKMTKQKRKVGPRKRKTNLEMMVGGLGVLGPSDAVTSMVVTEGDKAAAAGAARNWSKELPEASKTLPTAKKPLPTVKKSLSMAKQPLQKAKQTLPKVIETLPKAKQTILKEKNKKVNIPGKISKKFEEVVKLSKRKVTYKEKKQQENEKDTNKVVIHPLKVSNKVIPKITINNWIDVIKMKAIIPGPSKALTLPPVSVEQTIALPLSTPSSSLSSLSSPQPAMRVGSPTHSPDMFSQARSTPQSPSKDRRTILPSRSPSPVPAPRSPFTVSSSLPSLSSPQPTVTDGFPTHSLDMFSQTASTPQSLSILPLQSPSPVITPPSPYDPSFSSPFSPVAGPSRALSPQSMPAARDSTPSLLPGLGTVSDRPRGSHARAETSQMSQIHSNGDMNNLGEESNENMAAVMNEDIGIGNKEKIKKKKFPRQHICKHCGARFAYLRHLNNHIKAGHDGNPKYVCTICGKGIATSKALQDHHRRTHATPNLRCELCPDTRKTFKSNVAFKNHNKIFHSQRKCSFCQEVCVDKKAYDEHYKKIHNKPKHKNHPCPYCPTVLVGTSSLKYHIKAHHPQTVVEVAAKMVVEDQSVGQLEPNPNLEMEGNGLQYVEKTSNNVDIVFVNETGDNIENMIVNDFTYVRL